MDYSELLRTKAEDMTIVSEMLFSNKINEVEKNIIPQTVIENLHTSDPAGYTLYLKSGAEYFGDFHIHLSHGGAMTGKVHDRDSKKLYIKHIIKGVVADKLILTGNEENRPMGYGFKEVDNRARPLKKGEEIRVRKKSKKILRGPRVGR